MSNSNCAACEDLRNDAPNLIVNGLTNTEIASLKNNTGLSPSNGNNDCTDLNNMNDCFIGNMEAEVDAFDVCQWKEFMKRYIPNDWTVNAGEIAAICGLWTRLEAAEAELARMCAIMNATNSHPVHRYGTLPNGTHPERKGGLINNLNGVPALVAMQQNELSASVWANQNVGIYYGKLQTTGCGTSGCLLYEWIAPSFVGYKFNPSATINAGDILWYVDKTTAQQTWGITDHMWNLYTTSSWTWYDYNIANHTFGWFRLNINANGGMGANYLVLTYEGSTPSDNPAGYRINEPEEPDHLYISNC